MTKKITNIARTVAVLAGVENALRDFHYRTAVRLTYKLRENLIAGGRAVKDFTERNAYALEHNIDALSYRTVTFTQDLKDAAIEKHRQAVVVHRRKLQEEATLRGAAAVERIKKAMDEAGNDHKLALALRQQAEDLGAKHTALVDAHGG